MVAKKTKTGLIMLVVFVGGGLGGFLIYLSLLPLPNGQDPSLNLPIADEAHLYMIQGFGQVNPTYYHNGIDFILNNTTQIVAACDGFVSNVRFWYNDKGGHWQTNVNVQLNLKWSQEIIFESFAANQSAGQVQANAITVKFGDRIHQGEVIGTLLSQGSGSHVHFGLLSWGTAVCPYHYFSAAAKSTFDVYFTEYNSSAFVCN